MIDNQKEKHNWKFLFLGAGIDAFKDGGQFGIRSQDCHSVEHSGKGLRRAGGIMSYWRTDQGA